VLGATNAPLSSSDNSGGTSSDNLGANIASDMQKKDIVREKLAEDVNHEPAQEPMIKPYSKKL